LNLTSPEAREEATIKLANSTSIHVTAHKEKGKIAGQSVEGIGQGQTLPRAVYAEKEKPHPFYSNCQKSDRSGASDWELLRDRSCERARKGKRGASGPEQVDLPKRQKRKRKV